MKIKFKAPDPRAGTVAQMDSSRGQHFIDTGSADQITDGESGKAVKSVSAPTADQSALKRTPRAPRAA